MTDNETFAWICVALQLGGTIGYWAGGQRAVRLCRRIAKSEALDDVFREDAVADARVDDAVAAAARRRFDLITRGRA